MLNRMKVSTRLALGFGIVMLLLAASSIFSILKLATLNQDIQEITNNRYSKAKATNEIAFLAMDNARVIRNIILRNDDYGMAENKEIYDKNIIRTNELFEQLGRSVQSESGKALLKKMHETNTAYREYSEEVIRLGLANKDAEATRVLYGEGYKKQKEYFSAIKMVEEFQEKKIEVLARIAADDFAQVRDLIVLLFGSALVVGVGTAVFVIRSVTSQLGGEPGLVVAIARKIAEGDFTMTVATQPGDTQSILASIKQMHEGLKSRDALITNKTEQLEQSATKTQNYLDTMQGMLLALDSLGNITMINRHACDLLGYTEKELMGRHWYSTCLPQPEGMELAYPKFKKFMEEADDSAQSIESKILLKDKSQRHISFYETHLRDRNGNVTGALCSGRDITERKHAEEKLRLAASVFTSAQEGIMITDKDWNILDVNNAFTQITGYGRNEVLGHYQMLIDSNRHGTGYCAEIRQLLAEKGHWYGELSNQRKNGEPYISQLIISAVYDGKGSMHHQVVVFSDITQQKEHQKQLEYIAHFDSLTGLPNRILLSDRLRQAMVQSKRSNQRLVVLYIDLDGFKAVNDNHGHQIGDQLLISVATQMKQALREGDTIARIGGDEFVAIFNDLSEAGKANSLQQLILRLLAAASQTVRIGSLELQISCSIGATFFPQLDDIDADQLIRQADLAMYQAKVNGKNCYYTFDVDRDRDVRGHHDSLTRIGRALEQQEFVLYYQPIVNLRTGEKIGVEALIRWNHPDRGLLPPAYFLPDIENHSLGIKIGEWVIDTALSQIDAWQRQGLNLPVSVNVSANHLQCPEFVNRLKELLAAHPSVLPEYLKFEVLESSVLSDMAHSSGVIKRCSALGVKFALDDFGTGFSSLTYLKRLPTQTLKIDQSFIRDMLEDTDDLSILEGVLRLAVAFDRKAIAEGVETVAHGKMLIQLGCEFAQGYGISRPIPAADMPGWIEHWQPDAAWSATEPLSQENLPILHGIVEHRAWIRVIENSLNGKSDSLPMPDYLQCQFGRWLLSARSNAQKSQETILRVIIEPQHQKIHKLATELLELKIQGHDEEALNRLPELFLLRDELLEHLSVLI